MISDERLAAIEVRVSSATPGPWTATCRDMDQQSGRHSGLGWEIEGPPEPILRGQFALAEDAQFIAHAREDIPALLAEVDRLRAYIVKAQEDFAIQVVANDRLAAEILDLYDHNVITRATV